MRHKRKLFLFLFTTSFIFLLFSLNVIGIVNEKDIFFSFFVFLLFFDLIGWIKRSRHNET